MTTYEHADGSVTIEASKEEVAMIDAAITLRIGWALPNLRPRWKCLLQDLREREPAPEIQL